MNRLKKNWKLVIAIFLMLTALMVFLLGYRPAKLRYETQKNELDTSIMTLQTTISENLRYAGIQDKLEAEMEKIQLSRQGVYEKFPKELKEEDQIMYILYLERLFGNEIDFSFGSVSNLRMFSDGAALNGLTLTVNYEASYDGFQKMIDYLAADTRLTSVQYATMNYDKETDTVEGSLTILRYILDSKDIEYYTPDVTKPGIGKDNIFIGGAEKGTTPDLGEGIFSGKDSGTGTGSGAAGTGAGAGSSGSGAADDDSTKIDNGYGVVPGVGEND